MSIVGQENGREKELLYLFTHSNYLRTSQPAAFLKPFLWWPLTVVLGSWEHTCVNMSVRNRVSSTVAQIWAQALSVLF